jgi:hypothetical protein
MAGFPFPFPLGGAAIQSESSLSPDTFPLDAFRTGDEFFFSPFGNAYDGSGTITQVETTPEPTSILLTATGVAWLIRRRRSAQSQEQQYRAGRTSPVKSDLGLRRV